MPRRTITEPAREIDVVRETAGPNPVPASVADMVTLLRAAMTAAR